MKKIILIFLIIFSNEVKSQILKYNFGISSSNLKTADQDTTNNAEYKSLFGVNVGVTSVNTVDDKISLLSTFTFLQKGFIRSDIYQSSNAGVLVDNTTEEKITESLLQFSTCLNYNISDKFSVNAGPYVEYILDGKVSLRQNSQQFNNAFSYSDNWNYGGPVFRNKFSFGINLSSAYRLSKYFDFSVSYNIANFSNANSSIVYNNSGSFVRHKLNSLNINLSYLMEMKN